MIALNLYTANGLRCDPTQFIVYHSCACTVGEINIIVT